MSHGDDFIRMNFSRWFISILLANGMLRESSNDESDDESGWWIAERTIRWTVEWAVGRGVRWATKTMNQSDDEFVDFRGISRRWGAQRHLQSTTPWTEHAARYSTVKRRWIIGTGFACSLQDVCVFYRGRRSFILKIHGRSGAASASCRIGRRK